jgi:hypothetical protein
MLRETPTSLRAYFWLITIFALLPVVGQVSEGKIDPASVAISLVFGGIYGFVAIRMERLLATRPGVIRGVLIMNLTLAGLSGLLAALNGRIWSALPYLAIAFAITAYLLSSVGRLSAETSPLKKKEPNQ